MVSLNDILEVQEAVEQGHVAQADLARRSGLSTTTISAIINHPKPDPRIRTAEKLVEAYRQFQSEQQPEPAGEAV